jgi:hypothetical protein
LIGNSASTAAEDKVLSQLSVGEPDRPASKMDPYTAAVDALFPIKKEVEAAKGKGLDVPITDDPYVASRLYGGWVGKAQVALDHEGPFDFFTYKNLGPSLKEILAPVRDQISSWRAFLTSARAVELERVKGMPSGIDQTAAQTVGRNAPKLYKDQAALLYHYQNQISAYARDGGVISRGGYQAQRDDHQNPNHRFANSFRLSLRPARNFPERATPPNRHTNVQGLFHTASCLRSSFTSFAPEPNRRLRPICFLSASDEPADEHTNAQGNSHGLIGVLVNQFIGGFGAFFSFRLQANIIRFGRFHYIGQPLPQIAGFLTSRRCRVLQQRLGVSCQPLQVTCQFLAAFFIRNHNDPFFCIVWVAHRPRSLSTRTLGMVTTVEVQPLFS